MGEAKLGGFPLFSGKVRIVSRTLSGLFLVGAVDRPRKRKRTNRENPQRAPGKKSGKPQEGQKRKDKSRLGNPPVWKPPRLAALEPLVTFRKLAVLLETQNQGFVPASFCESTALTIFAPSYHSFRTLGKAWFQTNPPMLFPDPH